MNRSATRFPRFDPVFLQTEEIICMLTGRKPDLEALGIELQIPCDSGTRVPRDYHKHQCPKCGETWAHLDEVPALVASEAENKAAHTCKSCGTEQYWKLGHAPAEAVYHAKAIA